MFATVRKQPLATLRTRSRYRSAAKAVLFEVSNVATSFRVASVALCDISTVSRVVLCDRRSTFALFSKDDSNFRGKSSIFETSIVILRGRCGTADVLRSVFLRIALSGLRQVVTTCKFRGRHGILCHLSLNFEVVDLGAHEIA